MAGKKKTKPRERSGKRRETVFLSGTDQVKDVISILDTGLKRMGFAPLWFHKDFPVLNENAMDECLKHARQCDRLILVLDERAGLTYKPLGITITEAEFNVAHERGVPCLVCIRKRVFEQARIYHKVRVEHHGSVDEQHFKGLMMDADQEVYEFIERIQHKKRNGQPAVPWIIPFDFGNDLPKEVRRKWLISDKNQISVLKALHSVGEAPEAVEATRHRRVGRVHFTENAAENLARLSERDREQFINAVQALQDGAASDPINPLGIKHLESSFLGESKMAFRAGKLYIILSVYKDEIVIHSLHRRF